MTISTTTSRVQFAGNGSTTEFACGFTVLDEDHLEVYLDSTLKTITTHYTVAGVPGSATVTMLTAPASGETLTIRRVVPLTQASDYINGGALDVDSVLEVDLDKGVQMAQQLNEVDSRSLKLPATTEVADPETSSVLPDISSAEANKALVVNSAGTGFTYTALTSLTTEDVTYLAGDAKKPIGVSDDGTQLEARDDLELTSLAVDDTTDLAGTGPAPFSQGLKANTLVEKDAGSGFTADGTLLKDGYAPFPPRHIQGIVISNDTDTTNDINFTAGSASTYTAGGVRYNTIAAAEMTKRADATWAAGDDAGGLPDSFSGTWPASADDYHLFLLGKTTDQAAYDYGFDTSLTAANLLGDAAVVAAGFNTYRRVASLRSSATPSWPGITARELGGGGLEALLKVPVKDYDATNPGTSAVTVTLGSCPGGLDYIIRPIGVWQLVDGSPAAITNFLITSLALTDSTPSSSLYHMRIVVAAGNATEQFLQNHVPANSSRQVRYRLDNSDAGVTIRLWFSGWTDTRI